VPRKAPKLGRLKSRSAAQREGSAAMVQVMKAWEELSDEKRLTWRTHASTRRMDGIALASSLYHSCHTLTARLPGSPGRRRVTGE